MSTIPTLPGCGRPATIRIEAYAPLDGRMHGTLDASVYVCPDHAAPTVTVLEAVGFATRRLAGGTEVKGCGDGLDFADPTEVRTLAAPVSAIADTTSATPHPAWCDRQNCVGRDEHRSVALDASPLVRAAIAALDAFGAVSQREARTLLGMWARRDQLTPGEVGRVLDHYPTPGSVPARRQHPTGLDYERGQDEPTGGPVPPGVDGYPVGGRETGR